MPNALLVFHGDNNQFKTGLKKYFTDMLINRFNHSNTCTWLSTCRCARCRMTQTLSLCSVLNEVLQNALDFYVFVGCQCNC